MQAEWSVEIGPDAPALEVPWRSEHGSLRYFDLKKHPELLLEIPETLEHAELGEFLSGVNEKSQMASAKCDVWVTDEMSLEDEIFGEPVKRSSYVDLFFDGPERFEFSAHERLADLIVTKFGNLPEMPARLEIVIRQCHFHRLKEPGGDSDAGFSFTFYVTGYGDDEAKARVRWAIALNLLRNAIVQVAHGTER